MANCNESKGKKTYDTYFNGIPRNIALLSDVDEFPPEDVLEPDGASTGATDGNSCSLD